MGVHTWIHRAVSEAEGLPARPDDSGTELTTAGYLLRDGETGIVVREATLEDAPELAGIGSRALHHSHSGFLDLSGLAGLTSRVDLPAVRRQMRDPKSRWLVALWERNTVGFAVLREGAASEPEDRPLEIHGLYVAPDWMGRGVGSVLVKGAVTCARGEAFPVLWTAVVEGNPAAARFFRTWGFEPIGRERYAVGRKHAVNVVVLTRPA